jgi:hypothetical protein
MTNRSCDGSDETCSREAATDTSWCRNELATLTEQGCEQVIERQLQKWVREVEVTDGPAAAEED